MAESDIIKDALERYGESKEVTSENRRWHREDTRFARDADQWPDRVRKQREQESRPVLTINKMPAFIRQVVNEARQNRPSIAVHPVDNDADPDTATVIDGLIKSIERQSNADVAYDTAIDHAVTGGFGFFRIGIDYCHADSFDLECRIERVPNALMVHWDPSSTAFDASDWDFAFVSEFMSEDQFEAQYPGKAPTSFMDTEDDKDQTLADQLRLVEYWRREQMTRKIVLLSNGRVMREELLTEEVMAELAMASVEPLREREAEYHKVTRQILSGTDVLSEEDWPGDTIPICPVWGDEVMVDGRRQFRSMIRDARDAQTMFNFWRSATTELVALAPRAPFIGPQGFTKGNEVQWETANTRSHATLEYAGQIPPQRQSFAGVPAGALQEALNASDDMKSIIGIYDSSLGARSNETSGRAIMARQREGDTSNFHFIDNLTRGIRYAGSVLVDIIPSVYSARQTIRIVGEGETQKVARLTQENPSEEQSMSGQERLYNIGVGLYDVTVNAGPSYATQRQETREILIEMLRARPDLGAVVGDILMKSMDFPEAEKVAKRLSALLPPQIQKMEAEGENLPPEAAAMVASLTQQIEAMQQEMQKAAPEKAEMALKAREQEFKEKQHDDKMALEIQKMNDERAEAMGMSPDGTPPEDRLVLLAHAIQAMSQQIEASNQQTSAAIRQIAQAVTAPKSIVRDETGAAVGVVSEGGPVRPIIRDDQGRAAGVGPAQIN